MMPSSKCRPRNSAGRFWVTLHRTKLDHGAFATEPFEQIRLYPTGIGYSPGFGPGAAVVTGLSQHRLAEPVRVAGAGYRAARRREQFTAAQPDGRDFAVFGIPRHLPDRTGPLNRAVSGAAQLEIGSCAVPGHLARP